jgi:hypothetical protein
MSYNYTLKYRTFDQLIAAAKGDFRKYDLNDEIMDQDLVKVAQRVNYDLGLRINETKEIVLEVEKGRVRLPNNFYTLNFMFMCGTYETKQYLPQGTQVEERVIDPVAPVYQPTPPNVIDVCTDPVIPEPCEPCNDCGTPCCDTVCACAQTAPCNTSLGCSINCKGETIQLVQTLKFETRTFSTMKPVKLLENAQSIDCDCPNLYWESPFTGWIKDGWLYLNFKTGKIYLNYQGSMEDDDGNLLVLDHDMINEYYEYALKQRILENLVMNDANVSQAKIQLIEQRYRLAKSAAKSIVNTPNYSELKRVWKMNRKALWGKYYNMFSSYPVNNVSNLNGTGTNRREWQRNE